MAEEVQESLQHLSTQEQVEDYPVEPPLKRGTSFNADTAAAAAVEEDGDDFMPGPTSDLARASSEPIGSPGKSPFRQKRRLGRKSLRQQNPSHPLHSLLPEEMQETETTDEQSALARAKAKRKRLLERRQKGLPLEESDEEEEGGEAEEQQKEATTDNKEEEEQQVNKVLEETVAHHHSRKDSVASFASSISSGPLIPPAVPAVPTANPNNLDRTNSSYSNNSNQYTSCSADGSPSKNPINLDKFFQMERQQSYRHQHQQQKLKHQPQQQQDQDQYLQQEQEQDQHPPTPPSSPMKLRNSTAAAMDNIDKLISSYSFDSENNENDDVTSLEGSQTVNSQTTNVSNTPALFKGYQETLARQLSELHKLCEQDNHVDAEEDDAHSTFTNPDNISNSSNNNSNNNNNNTKGRRQSLASSASDHILHKEEEEEEEEEDSAEDDQEASEEEKEGEDSSQQLQDTAATTATTNNPAPAQKSDFRRVPSPTSELPSIQEVNHDAALPTIATQQQQQQQQQQDAPPISQTMDRDLLEEVLEQEEAETNNEALAEMKTPKKSNLSPKEEEDDTSDDDESDLEDLYQDNNDKWGKADMKGESAEVMEQDDDDDNHVSTTAKVALAAVAVVAGFCVRTFSRHR